jgi:hypothetical protein
MRQGVTGWKRSPAALGNPIPCSIEILAGENRQGAIDNVTVNGAIVSTRTGE